SVAYAASSSKVWIKVVKLVRDGHGGSRSRTPKPTATISFYRRPSPSSKPHRGGSKPLVRLSLRIVTSKPRVYFEFPSVEMRDYFLPSNKSKTQHPRTCSPGW